MSKTISKSRDHALVIGASISGLMAARALANHFRRVTVLERDEFPPFGKNRKGVPQGRHIHVLLEQGRIIMEDFFPGLSDRLSDLGAVTVADTSENMRWFHSGGYHQPGAGGFPSLAISRPTLEAAIRERAKGLRNVNIVSGCNVLGLTTPTSSNRRVSGVKLVDRKGGRSHERLAADLIVDATGRGSRTPVWLQDLGYQRPDEDEVRIGMGYATCFYHRQPEHIPGIEGIVIMATPPDRRLAVLLAQDGQRWVLTLGGYLNQHAPTAYEGFLEAVRELPSPDIYNVVKNVQPLGDPVAYKFPANLRHRYEALSSFPEGYLVIGDALCSFNPIYGQGMTVASLEAETLAQCLADGDDQLARRFFARASKIIAVSWNAAVGTDLGFAEIEGPRTPMTRFLNWYIGKVHRAAHHDAQVSIAFLKVINMLAPPPSILHPRIVWRVLKGNLWPDRPTGIEAQKQARTSLEHGPNLPAAHS